MWMIAITSRCTNKLTVKGPLVIVIRTLLVVVTTIAITLMGFMITIRLDRDPACITGVGRSKSMMPRTSQCHVNHDSDVGEFYQECLHVVYVCFWSPNDPLELNRGQVIIGWNLQFISLKVQVSTPSSIFSAVLAVCMSNLAAGRAQTGRHQV